MDIQIIALENEVECLNNEIKLLIAIGKQPEQLISLELSGEDLEGLSGEGLLGKIGEKIKKAAKAARAFIIRIWKKLIGLFGFGLDGRPRNIKSFVDNLILEHLENSERTGKNWESINIDLENYPIKEKRISSDNMVKIDAAISEISEDKRNDLIDTIFSFINKRKINVATVRAITNGEDLLNGLNALYQVSVGHQKTVDDFYAILKTKLKDVKHAIESDNRGGVIDFVYRGAPSIIPLEPISLELKDLFGFIGSQLPNLAAMVKDLDVLIKKPSSSFEIKVGASTVDLSKANKQLSQVSDKIKKDQTDAVKLYDQQTEIIHDLIDDVEDTDNKEAGDTAHDYRKLLAFIPKVDTELGKLFIQVSKVTQDVAMYHTLKNTLTI